MGTMCTQINNYFSTCFWRGSKRWATWLSRCKPYDFMNWIWGDALESTEVEVYASESSRHLQGLSGFTYLLVFRLLNDSTRSGGAIEASNTQRVYGQQQDFPSRKCVCVGYAAMVEPTVHGKYCASWRRKHSGCRHVLYKWSIFVHENK